MRRLATFAAVCAALGVLAGVATAARPLRTGFLDPVAFSGPRADQSFARARTAGASVVRLFLPWSAVATTQPASPADPDDPVYQWGLIDQQVRDAVRHGLTPLVYISGSPGWARGAAVDLPGTWPSATAFASFARAAATRFSGHFRPSGDATLPRVRYWQAWNEPNAGREMSPQRRGKRPVSPAHYRLMLNAFAQAVHGIDRSNLVVAGTLGPFGHDSKDIQVLAPKTFMGELLCVSPVPPHRKTCSQRTHFDVWAHNSYTNGGPNWQANNKLDVSLGDLGEMQALLQAAERSHTIVSARRPEFWVTELSWDTKPPDPDGVPLALHARWVSESLYRMWKVGVSTAVWFRLEDDPLRESPYQSGFFTVGGRSKYSLEAFRFPFVALGDGKGISVWGRTPSGKAATVVVQRKTSGRWVSAARLRADRYGIFSRRLPRTSSTTAFRARLGSGAETSIPFALIGPREHRISPFGCGGSISC